MSPKKLRKYKNKILAAVHETARDFYDSGLIDAEAMQEFDKSCLVQTESHHINDNATRLGDSTDIQVNGSKRVRKMVFTGRYGSPGGDDLFCERCKKEILTGEEFTDISHGDGTGEALCSVCNQQLPKEQ
jgi:hypothetical protein